MRFTIFNFLICSYILLSFGKGDSVIKNQEDDFKVYRSILKAKEGIIDIHIPLDSIESNFEQLGQALKERKTQIELFKLFSSTTAKIQCGHTQLQPSKQVIREWVLQKNSLPIDYILVGKKLFTKKLEKSNKKAIPSTTDNTKLTDYEKSKNIPSDCEIYSIEDRTIPEMMKDISKYVSSDEDGIDFKYYQTAQLFEFFRNITYPIERDSIKVTYILKKDTIHTYLQSGFPPINSINKRLVDFEKKINKNAANKGEFNILKGKYGYFKFVSFANCRGVTYEEFLKKSFETLKNKKIKYLIVDLRGNTGGQMQYSFMRYIVGSNVKLGTYFVEKPKKMFENRHLKKRNRFYFNHRLLSAVYKYKKKIKPDYDGTVCTGKVEEKLVYKGKIIVITDEGTFSAGSILACNLKTLVNAKIVGQKAGGSFYKGNAGTLKVVLPKSKLFLFVNPNTFRTQLEDNTDSQSIKVPDYILDPIYPNSKKKDDWYINRVTKLFKK